MTSLIVLAVTFGAGPSVEAIRIAPQVYRPQAVVDAAGTLHVVHALHGKNNRGELRYIRRRAGETEFSKPISVNSTPNCAAGFNMAVGPKGRVHVVIRPTAGYSMKKLGRKVKFNDLKYMLYCRLNDEGTAFEEERDLSAATFGFEGVGAVLAGSDGTVYVFWHGLAEPGPENTRKIFHVESRDEGRTFGAPAASKSDVIGACQCCSMQGLLDDQGHIYVAFRNSHGGLVNKDSYLMTSTDRGRTFKGKMLSAWPVAGCPGSTYSLAAGPHGVAVAWDTMGKVSFALGNGKQIDAPTGDLNARGPIVATNARGETLFAWSETETNFRNGATLAWCVYDKDGNPLMEKQTRPFGVARWSTPTAFVKPNGDFVLLHDGHPPHGQAL